LGRTFQFTLIWESREAWNRCCQKEASCCWESC